MHLFMLSFFPEVCVSAIVNSTIVSPWNTSWLCLGMLGCISWFDCRCNVVLYRAGGVGKSAISILFVRNQFVVGCLVVC